MREEEMMDGTDWRLRVNHSRCMGTTICATTAPGRFEINSDGQSEPVAETAAAATDVMRAAELCPMEAISVALADTGEELFPGNR
jgi:ferredoxin